MFSMKNSKSCHSPEMIHAQFLIGQHFLVSDKGLIQFEKHIKQGSHPNVVITFKGQNRFISLPKA